MKPIERMLLSLQGLSVGDAFGESFFAAPQIIKHMLLTRKPPPLPWPYTDDTEMALSIVDVLRKRGQIEQDDLAQGFARRFEPHRSYGAGAYGLLSEISAGADWREKASGMFGGSRSFGNGAADADHAIGCIFCR